MMSPLLLLLAPLAADPAPLKDRLADAAPVAAKIDEFTAKYWQDGAVKPADPADDAEFLRRVSLDLAGRVPTYREARDFAADHVADRRAQLIRRLLDGPEHPLHFGRVLDDLIQGKYAGDPDFLEYLRSSVTAHKGWDQMFREILIGPWDVKERKGADRFLAKRLASLDDLTNDTSRVFFGVNVSCARCHDHPLVSDWKQDHYYGMASFFNRTYDASKAKPADGVKEAATGDLGFVRRNGKKDTAKLMFISGTVVQEPSAAEKPAAPYSRREQLVKVALEEKTYFRRAIVNQLWSYFLGRGLVQPVDQMHSANPPEIPDLLEWLGDDFADNGYDLDRLVAAIVSSRVYQMSSIHGPADSSRGAYTHAALRPLTPYQFALSMTLAAGDGKYDEPADAAARAQRRRDLETQIAALVKLDMLDPRSDRYQSSAVEALFVSNHPEIQKLTTAAGENLPARMAAAPDSAQAVDLAVWTVFGRAPRPGEKDVLGRFLDERKEDRPRACGELVWALLSSAEFRFNH